MCVHLYIHMSVYMSAQSRTRCCVDRTRCWECQCRGPRFTTSGSSAETHSSTASPQTAMGRSLRLVVQRGRGPVLCTGAVVLNKTASQERGEHFLVLPQSGHKYLVCDVFRASGRVPDYRKNLRPRPLGGGRGRDKSLPKGIGIVV